MSDSVDVLRADANLLESTVGTFNNSLKVIEANMNTVVNHFGDDDDFTGNFSVPSEINSGSHYTISFPPDTDYWAAYLDYEITVRISYTTTYLTREVGYVGTPPVEKCIDRTNPPESHAKNVSISILKKNRESVKIQINENFRDVHTGSACGQPAEETNYTVTSATYSLKYPLEKVD